MPLGEFVNLIIDGVVWIIAVNIELYKHFMHCKCYNGGVNIILFCLLYFLSRLFHVNIGKIVIHEETILSDYFKFVF